MSAPRDAALRTCLRPTTAREATQALYNRQVIENTHPLHSRSVASAVYQTSTRKPRRVNGQIAWTVTRRWTVVDVARGPDGRLHWAIGDHYPTD